MTLAKAGFKVLKAKMVTMANADFKVLKATKVNADFKVSKVFAVKKVTREILLKSQLLVEQMAIVLTLHLHFLEKSLL